MLLKLSLHQLAFQLVPGTSSKSDSADLPCYKLLCSGLLIRPLPYGTLLKVSPKECHNSIGCSTQMHGSAMGVTHVSWGWLLKSLFLWSTCSCGFPEASVPDNESEQSLLGETLEVLLRDSSRDAIGSPLPVPPLLVDLHVKKSRRSLNTLRRVSRKTAALVNQKNKFWFL